MTTIPPNSDRAAPHGYEFIFTDDVLTVRKASTSGCLNVGGIWAGFGICLLLLIMSLIVAVKAVTAASPSVTNYLIAILFLLPGLLSFYIARRLAEILFSRELTFRKRDTGNISCTIAWPISTRTVELLAPVVIRAYLGRSRSDWGFSINVEDATGRRVRVIVPTTVGNQADARGEARAAGEYLAKCLGIACEMRP